MNKYILTILIGLFFTNTFVSAITPINRVEITPTTASSYVDVDVSAYVDAGKTAGVILEIVNTSGTEYRWFARKNGSTDDWYGVIEDTGHTWYAVGVDSNDILECYVTNTTNVDIFIVGYIKKAEGYFFTNFSNNITQGLGTGSWYDRNLSEYSVGNDIIKTVFLLIGNNSAHTEYGFRKNGSTDNRIADIFAGDKRGAMMSVDENEILEINKENNSFYVYISGYLTDNVYSWTNAKDYSTANLGAYQEIDFSSDIPSGNNGALVHFCPTVNNEYKGNIRSLDDSWDSYYDITKHQYLWTKIDSDRKAEQRVESISLDLYLWGYTNWIYNKINLNKGKINLNKGKIKIY